MLKPFLNPNYFHLSFVKIYCLVMVLLFSLAYLNAFAEISWQDKSQTFHLGIKDKTLSTHFDFTNHGLHPVTITGVETSCGCTVAELSKMTFSAGETGSVNITYKIGAQTGIQVKTIAVSTDDVQAPRYILSLIVYLPDLLKIFPRYVFWDFGESPSSQSIKLEASPSVPVKVLSVTSNNSKINVTLGVQREGIAYSILVSPTNTNAAVRAALTIETNLQLNGKNRNFYAYADIRPKMPRNQ